jgi:protein-disulfide isomerase
MNKKRSLIALALLMISLLLISCVDKGKIVNIEEQLTEIHATLKNLEEKIDKLPRTAAPRKPNIDYNKVHNLPLGTSAIKGNKDAPVTIVEFSDFQCPYCARVQPTLRQVLQAYPNEVKLVYKDFPLSFHQHARNAAKAARAAGEQGKYWEMHDLIFEKYSSLTVEMFKEFAAKLNLDMNRFASDFSSNKYDNLIQQDMNLGRKAGVAGTPTLFMNGKRMKSRSFVDFKTAIDGYLKQQKQKEAS